MVPSGPVLTVGLVCLALALPLRAAVYTWTGGGAPDANWGTPANWGNVTLASATNNGHPYFMWLAVVGGGSYCCPEYTLFSARCSW